MVDPALLGLAISSRRSDLLDALAEVGYARSAYLELAVRGLPGVREISLYVWPTPAGRPVHIGVDVVRLGREVLARPIVLGFDLTPDEKPDQLVSDHTVVTAADLAADLDGEDRPAVIQIGDREWLLVAHRGTQKEVQDLDADGRPLFKDVETSVYCYRLVCPRCGRARFAKRNSIHQIKFCRVCTRQERLRRRALSQYRMREQRTWSVPRAAPPSVLQAIEQRYKAGETQAKIARELDLSPGAVCKILKKRGLR